MTLSSDDIFQIPLVTLDGATTTLSSYKGSVLLVVNVASKCGFTPQYQGLEALYQQHNARGFVVLGFPCNQFGGQEPGTADDIKQFCSLRYEVSFPMFEKVKVNGPDTHPLYKLLKAAKPGVLGTEAIKWNFTKFLIGRDGNVLERFAPNITPEALAPAITQALDFVV